MPEDMQEDVARGTTGASTPSPDPTVLTTEALQREILALRQLLELRVTGLRELLEQHIEGIVGVREQEFIAVRDKLAMIENQRIEQKADTKAAVDAALTAQKEAVAKTEVATDKQLTEIKSTFATEIGGLRREINALAERIGRVEFGPPPPSGG